jgi:hypothetical protein
MCSHTSIGGLHTTGMQGSPRTAPHAALGNAPTLSHPLRVAHSHSWESSPPTIQGLGSPSPYATDSGRCVLPVPKTLPIVPSGGPAGEVTPSGVLHCDPAVSGMRCTVRIVVGCGRTTARPSLAGQCSPAALVASLTPGGKATAPSGVRSCGGGQLLSYTARRRPASCIIQPGNRSCGLHFA